MIKFYVFLFILFISCAVSFPSTGEKTCVSNTEPLGHLVIIGGGYRDSLLMVKFVELAGGVNSRFLIIPNASGDPENAGKELLKEFKGYGCKNAEYIVFNQELANSDSLIAASKDFRGIYFSGGDQVLHTKALLGTKFISLIKDLYYKGAVVGGTSAGAAIMSRVMITGEEKINKDKEQIFNTIMPGNVETLEGFGFMENVIVDQHFILRKRLNRLISVCLENPTLLGIGIDEETAIIVKPDNTFEVMGNRTVLIIDPTNAINIKTNPESLFSGENIGISILQSGQIFDLKNKKVVK